MVEFDSPNVLPGAGINPAHNELWQDIYEVLSFKL